MRPPLLLLSLLALLLIVSPVRGQSTGNTRHGAPSHHLGTAPGEDTYELLDIDTLFYINNRGLTRILVNLNGHAFKLVVDEQEVRRSRNAFLIPRVGEITIDIAAYMIPGDNNLMSIQSQGPPQADAELIIGDLLLPGQDVAYAVTDLAPIPVQLSLVQSYPNPFQNQTTLVYQIPEERTSGVPVRLAIYDLLGRQIKLLVDDRRYPGTFIVPWDGTCDDGRDAAAGVYFAHLQTDTGTHSHSIVRLH